MELCSSLSLLGRGSACVDVLVPFVGSRCIARVVWGSPCLYPSECFGFLIPFPYGSHIHTGYSWLRGWSCLVDVAVCFSPCHQVTEGRRCFALDVAQRVSKVIGLSDVEVSPVAGLDVQGA